MKILRVLLQMFRELVNLPRKERDLHIRRASVRVVPGGIFYDYRLFPSGKHDTTLPRPAFLCKL